jgi:hypothetical protein
MGIRARFAIIILGTVAIMAAIAYGGVTAEVKPVPWLNIAFLAFYLSLLAGLAWAFQPVAARMKSAIFRYLVKSLGVIISFILLAFCSYTIFLHFCVLFG